MLKLKNKVKFIDKYKKSVTCDSKTYCKIKKITFLLNHVVFINETADTQQHRIQSKNIFHIKADAV